MREKIKKKLIMKGAGIAATIFAPLIALLFVVLILISVASSATAVPNLEDDRMQEFQGVATYCKLNWAEFLAYLMVKYENELDEVDPEDEALNFMIVYFTPFEEEVEEDEEGRKKVIGMVEGETEIYETKRQILRFLRAQGYDDIDKATQAVDCLNEIEDNEVGRVRIESKDFQDFEDEFTPEQVEWYSMLINDHVIQEIIGEYYELPENIEIQTKGFFGWPVSGLIVTSPFGMRYHPVDQVYKFHTGIDLAGRGCDGMPVGASAPGTVELVSRKSTGYGNMVLISHVDAGGNNWSTRYAHLSEITVEQGEAVERGTVVGAIGSTGKSTGPHLHYEIIFQGSIVDPEKFLQ